MAFPNAYVSTDELPRRSRLRRTLYCAGAAGLGYLGAVILLLSIFWHQYDPVTQAASDYGVGAFALEMNSGFLVAGAGVLTLAAALLTIQERWQVKAGALLLVPSGMALVTNAFFPTDVEGATRTFHGLVHGLGGAVFFFTAPAGLLLISWRFGRGWFGTPAVAVALAFASLVIPPLQGIDAGGLGERVLILVVFSAGIATALRMMREA
ncbi:MAG: DUF998 domain-containing protein [Thaumarchaeota archaeon]|nr:DUF998 domain-containing protein [Nitrososphaerota archaeon]